MRLSLGDPWARVSRSTGVPPAHEVGTTSVLLSPRVPKGELINGRETKASTQEPCRDFQC